MSPDFNSQAKTHLFTETVLVTNDAKSEALEAV